MCGLYQSRYLNPLVYQRIRSSRRGEVEQIPAAVPYLIGGLGADALTLIKPYMVLLLSVKEW